MRTLELQKRSIKRRAVAGILPLCGDKNLVFTGVYSRYNPTPSINNVYQSYGHVNAYHRQLAAGRPGQGLFYPGKQWPPLRVPNGEIHGPDTR